MEAGNKNLEALTKKISDLREHLSMIFYRYVSGKNNFDREVTIRVHDSPLDELDPFMKSEKQEYGTQSRKIKIPVFFEDDCHYVDAEFVILPQRSMINDEDTYKRLGDIKSHNRSQGIYIFRNDRLIMHDEWMNIRQIEDKYKCAKVSIDIPKALDEYFQIDPTKTYYEFPSDFSEDLKEAMYTPTRHWEVNKKKYNFMERARYRYTNETKKKLSSVTKTSAFSKSAGETLRIRRKVYFLKKKYY